MAAGTEHLFRLQLQELGNELSDQEYAYQLRDALEASQKQVPTLPSKGTKRRLGETSETVVDLTSQDPSPEAKARRNRLDSQGAAERPVTNFRLDHSDMRLPH